MNLRFYDAEILGFDDLAILFQVEMETRKKGAEKGEQSTKVIRVEKAKLDGLMYKL
jgi:hypothetical protein